MAPIPAAGSDRAAAVLLASGTPTYDASSRAPPDRDASDGRSVQGRTLYLGTFRLRQDGRLSPAQDGQADRPRQGGQLFGCAWRGACHEAPGLRQSGRADRSVEHTSELQSLMRISYAVF